MKKNLLKKGTKSIYTFSEKILSPSKLNLNLVIGEFDKDIGLHGIESDMIEINFAEELEFKIEYDLGKDSSFFSFSCSPQEQECASDEKSSIYRAAKKWHEMKCLPLKLSVHHDDGVPAGKGLGIASSNAAAVIKVLEKTSSDLPDIKTMSDKELSSLALDTGSDVAFFLLGKGYAHISGFGEQVTPLAKPQQMSFLIALPPFRAETGKMFAMLYENGKRKYSDFCSLPTYREYREYLRKTTGSDKWQLTGSGSAFYIKNPDEQTEKMCLMQNKIKIIKAKSVF